MTHTHISLHRVASTAVIAMAIAGCGGDNSSPGLAAPATPSGVLISSVQPGTTLALEPHINLETMRANGERSTGQNILSATEKGLRLGTPDGNVWNVDVTAASSDRVTPSSQIFSGSRDLSASPACFGNCPYLQLALTGGSPASLTYSTYGLWAEGWARIMETQRFGTFATGTATPGSQIPRTGTAVYAGGFNGAVGEALGPNFRQLPMEFSFSGTATLNADFGANTIEGRVTNITGPLITPWRGAPPARVLNDIVLSGGTITGPSFAGVAAVAPASATTTLDLAGAVGQFAGQFYGPQAAEVAGTVALTAPATATANTFSIIGSFGAHK